MSKSIVRQPLVSNKDLSWIQSPLDSLQFKGGEDG